MYISNGEHKDMIIHSMNLYNFIDIGQTAKSYRCYISTILNTWQNIQMLYQYNTQYMTKHSATCFDADLNDTEKTWLSFNKSTVCPAWMAERLRWWPQNSRVVSSSPAVGKNNFSFCKSRFRSLQLEEVHANEINHDIHLANTLFQIKVR